MTSKAEQEARYAKAAAIEHARMLKATKLAGFLWGYRDDGMNITGATVRDLPPEGRRNVEHLTGVRRSSDETWELVAQIIDGMLAHPAPADPFEGLS